MINGSRFLDQLGIRFLPEEESKVITGVYRSSTVPLARDMQISILRNNMYTRKILYSMQVITDPFCVFCLESRTVGSTGSGRVQNPKSSGDS